MGIYKMFELILSFLQVGLFSIGGGYAAVPFIKAEIVDKHHWLSTKEFTDLISIAEMTPGPIAVNSATFVGINLGGITAAILATISCIFPSLIIVSLLYYFYMKYRNLKGMKIVLETIRPCIVALILCAGLSILLVVIFTGKEINFAHIDYISSLLFILAMVLLVRFKKNPILVMFLSGVIALVTHLIIPN